MGTRVHFWHGAADGLLGHFLGGPLDVFESWCQRILAEYPGDLEPALLPLLKAVQSDGRRALEAATVADAFVVDQLLDAYYGFFCDSERPDLLELADESILYVARYHTAFEALSRLSIQSTERLLWSYLVFGRPVERDPAVLPYTSEDGVFRLSYWSAEEAALLGRSFTEPPPRYLRDVDDGALQCTIRALRAAAARNSGLIISVG